jgi:hypothetical protein
VGGYQQAGIPFGRLSKEDQEAARQAIETLRRHSDEMEEWNGMMDFSANQTSYATQVMIASIGSAASAVVLGSKQIEQSLVTAIFSISAAIAQAKGFGTFGAILGAVGGVIGAVFQRGQQDKRDRERALQRVRIEEYSQRALNQQQETGPTSVTVQLFDPVTGELTRSLDEQEYQLYRRERRDAVKRLP